MFLGKFMSILKALLDAADEVNEIARKNFFRLRNFSAWGLENERKKYHTKTRKKNIPQLAKCLFTLKILENGFVSDVTWIIDKNWVFWVL